MAKREKLNIRLPDDPGPNLYDSKTPLKHRSPRWTWDWGWWVSIIIIGGVWYLVRVWRGMA